jgi:hypothetical protein
MSSIDDEKRELFTKKGELIYDVLGVHVHGHYQLKYMISGEMELACG